MNEWITNTHPHFEWSRYRLGRFTGFFRFYYIIRTNTNHVMRILRCHFHATHWYQIWQIVQTIALLQTPTSNCGQNIQPKYIWKALLNIWNCIPWLPSVTVVQNWNFEKPVLRFNRFRIQQFSGFYFKPNRPSLSRYTTNYNCK